MGGRHLHLCANLAWDTTSLSIPLRHKPEYTESVLYNVAAGRRREKTPVLLKQHADDNMRRLGEVSGLFALLLLLFVLRLNKYEQDRRYTVYYSVV